MKQKTIREVLYLLWENEIDESKALELMDGELAKQEVLDLFNKGISTGSYCMDLGPNA